MESRSNLIERVETAVKEALADPQTLRKWLETAEHDAFIARDCNECPVARYLEHALREAGFRPIAVDVMPLGLDETLVYRADVWLERAEVPVLVLMPEWSARFVRHFDDMVDRREVITKAVLVAAMQRWPVWS